MNSNQINIDPVTGQPLNQNINSINNPQIVTQPQINNTQNTIQQPIQPQPQMNTVQSTIEQPIQPEMAQVDITNNANQANIQQQMSTIPTVDQDKQEFITNTQATNEVKKEEKKDGPNIVFIVFIFAIIFGAIFFLFPYLLNVLG